MLRLSKLSVSEVLTKITRQFAAKGGKEGGKDGGSVCAPTKKFDLCESKKGGKDGKIEKCGGEGGGVGGGGRESSCKPKKQAAPKGSTADTLRKVCLFGVLPAVFLLNILIFSTRTHEEREEFKKWPHLYKRDKPFPWGDGQKSFFHNPHVNPLPDSGYEDDV